MTTTNEPSEQRWRQVRAALTLRGMSVAAFARSIKRSDMQVRRVVLNGHASPYVEGKLAEVLGADNPLNGGAA